MRGAKKSIAKIPLYQLDDYRLTEKQKGELLDWKFAAGDKVDFNSVWFLPYNITPDGVVEGDLELIDHKQERMYEVRSGPIGNLLLPGDELLSINGMPTDSGKEVFSECQAHRSLLIVSRTPELESTPLWSDSDKEFEKAFTDPALLETIQSIGEGETFTKNGYHLIEPIVPIPQLAFEMDLEDKVKLTEEYTQIQNEIEKMPSGDRKKASLKWLEKWKTERVLGVHLNDRTTIYNPYPQFLFNDVLSETWRTLRALVQGSLHPKWMSGPVGIVRVMHYGWSIGFKEALFWMAVISLNLGILNLLPIPVLDGGHICFSLWEMMTKKPLKSRTMELLIIPFVVVLIGFFIFATYNDIARLFGF
jgi:regulator of sigma E protease